MQLITFLALVCTIAVVLIQVNDGAPTTVKPTTVKIQPVTVKIQPTTVKIQPTTVKVQPAVVKVDAKPVITPGGRTKWSAKINAKSKKLFNDHKKIILKKLQEVHKVPSKFNPKPVRTATQMVAGVLHHYLVKLPVNKYAYITIVNQAWKKDQYGKEEHVTVRPQLYALNDKNI